EGAPVPALAEGPPARRGSDTVSCIRLLSRSETPSPLVAGGVLTVSPSEADAAKKDVVWSKHRLPAWFRSLRRRDRLDAGMQLRDVIRLAQHGGAILFAQRRVELRAAIAGRDHDRQAGACLAELKSERVAAPVGQSDVDDRERELRGTRD